MKEKTIGSFSYVYIPHDSSKEIQELRMDIPEGKEVECLLDHLKEHFERSSPRQTAAQRAAHRAELARNLPEGTEVDTSLLDTAAAMQLVETVSLLGQSKSNGFVGVNMYVDDSGALKNLPRNMRATEIAHCCGRPTDVKGDAFLARVMDDGENFDRMDFRISEVSSSAEWVQEAEKQAAAHRERESTESVMKRIGAANSGRISSSSQTSTFKELTPAESAKEDGNAAFKKGDYLQAISLYSKALALDENMLVARNNRAMAHLKVEQWEDARTDCESVLERDPRNVKALLRYAAANKELGYIDKARESLQKALEIQPTNKEAVEKLAMLSDP